MSPSIQKIVTITITSLLLNFCGTKKNNTDCENFKNYLTENFCLTDSILNNSVYYLLPLEVCKSTVHLHIDALKEYPQSNLIPIIIGKTLNPQYKIELNSLKEKYSTMLEDIKGNAFIYDIGLGKPLLIHIRQGKCIYYEFIWDDAINDIQKYLKKNSSIK